jgi:hypothetical protein
MYLNLCSVEMSRELFGVERVEIGSKISILCYGDFQLFIYATLAKVLCEA